ncbi:cytochrome P450 [Lentzea tibetensis]|uniref:Cytochrome P450 n=1 Tax=Lentzea tibetensis TaxID=2591470 RepID=A0A563EFQ9_9PSEU|nr:cytochrome P450 [Lentzea tibetensis]TWP43978.1 cytochrome P450 [Lentzea tibetensis]
MGETSLDDDFCQDRHSVYDRLRADAPVCPAVLPNGQRVWLATRYEDARALLAHPALSKDSNRATPLYERLAETEGVRRTYIAKVLRDHMLNLDPPDHTRLRRLVGAAFTLRRVELLRPRVEEIVGDLLDGLSGQVDLLEQYAIPVSGTVAGELFGVPVDERAEFRGLSQRIGQGADAEEVGRGFLAMADYLAALVARKREQPGDDLVTALVQARDEGDQLDEDELVSMVFLLLTAGFETTVHLVGNGVVALLSHPEQLALLRGDPSLLPRAVEELLRFDGPAGTATLRFTTEPVEVGGTTIPAEQFVLVPVGAANRDEARFPDPHALDITRDAIGHVGFGHGVHHCLGAPLARLTGQTAIGRLVERFPDLALVEPEKLRWRNNSLFRAYEQIFVTV